MVVSENIFQLHEYRCSNIHFAEKELNPIYYLKQDYEGIQNDFVNAVIQSIYELNGAGIEDSIVVEFNLVTDKVKNIKNADIAAALSNEENVVLLRRVIRYTDDPNAPAIRVEDDLPPLRYADLKQKVKEKNSCKIWKGI